MAAKDRLVAQLEIAQTKWAQSDEAARMELLRPFVNTTGITVFPKKRFEYLPEMLQLILSLFWMENIY